MSESLQREFEFHPKDFHFIAGMVMEKTGIVLADHKMDMVYARIARRLRTLGLGSFREYCALLESECGKEEIGNFVNAITTNLTSFFRESHHFIHLRDDVLKPLLKSPPADRKLRLWSAACSSGAEPYSMAMTCCEAIPDITKWDIKILATDIDTGMLAKASAGEYPASEAQSIPAPFQKYIDHASGKIQMAEKIRSLITFKQMNLMDNFPFKGGFDAVFCRNVVIYFNKDTQRTLFEKIALKMKPNGWLYIGHSENLHGISDRFQLQGRTLYRRVR